MPSLKETDKLHQEALMEWFQSKSPAWEALKAEFQVFRDNSLALLIDGSSTKRDYYAGYYRAIQDVIDTEDHYKRKANERPKPSSNS